ncbi:MAG: hypothetical protein GXD23_09425 [Comamonadaceae bacterium]|uniref:DUF1566 domain-containing protein n=1 Tax=Hydrogenophaga borbori TaxID=2294117 RepID=A0A372EGH5_9BURK|nr:hypothetical protein [Hydrogenophaga sp. SNF1]NCT97576.1 hypothetical protein [Comamonadaceae bacterium]RFP77495.1 hypothetical protein DY262_17245 [Hydrogenophaga borbori]WQB83209.1 hypothetical protein SOM08_19790 [Hydrogenophaga sp. SNF1]
MSQLALAASGQARTLTVTNTGAHTALDLALNATGLPAGTSPISTCGATLAAGASCAVTVTPGATATATPGNAAPTSAVLEVEGSNTNSVNAALQVITFGSWYQGGWVFDVDDTTVVSGSVGGKVAATSDATPAGDWGPASLTGAGSLTDGASNTNQIVTALGATPSAAGRCQASAAGGFSDWYLPALCELGYTFGGGACGTSAAPLLAGNMQSRLKENGDIGGIADSWYWSSTEAAVSPITSAHLHRFDPTLTQQAIVNKSNVYPVRCARALTP